MTPAEELRAATARLRCRHVFSVFSEENVRPACRRCGVLYKRHEAVAADVAEPLAAWLEALASGWQQSIALYPHGAAKRYGDHPALAVARVINGGAS